LERVLDVNVSHADLSVRARAAAPALRRLLRLRAGVPLIALERVSCDAAAAPLEHTLYWANAESYEFVLGVRGQVPITPSIRGIR
jgi:DNA-binding GntR family transcriptional regulator